MKQPKAVHLAWLCAILGLSVVILLTVRIGTTENLLNYISFAATLSSIILSVIAITYTFVSSGAANAVQANLVKTSSDMVAQFEGLTGLYTKMESLVSGIPETVGGAVSKAFEGVQAASDSAPPIPKTGAELNIELMKQTSPLYLLFLYNALRCVQRSRKAIDLQALQVDLGKPATDTNIAYWNGALKAIRSAGGIYFEQTKLVFYNFNFFDNDFGPFTDDVVLRESRAVQEKLKMPSELRDNDTQSMKDALSRSAAHLS